MLSFRAGAHTGVGIPIHIPKKEGDCHTSDIGHWFAMTAFLFLSRQPLFSFSFLYDIVEMVSL